MCAGINEIIKEKMKGRSPIQIYRMVDSIKDLFLIFGLNLSIGSPYYQGGRIWLIYVVKVLHLRWLLPMRDTLHTHKNSLHICLCTGSDDLAISAISALDTVRWSGPRPDDSAPVSCERLNLSVQVRMIWPLPGWSGSGTFWVPSSLWTNPDDPTLRRMIRTWEFSSAFLAYSVTHPDDPM